MSAGWIFSGITIVFSVCEGVLGRTSNSFKVGEYSRTAISMSKGRPSSWIGDEMRMTFLEGLSGVDDERAGCGVFGIEERGEISLRLRSTGEGVPGDGGGPQFLTVADKDSNRMFCVEREAFESSFGFKSNIGCLRGWLSSER